MTLITEIQTTRPPCPGHRPGGRADRHGEALWDRVRQSVGGVTAGLLATFDAGDIETTIRTLQAITARVPELHAR